MDPNIVDTTRSVRIEYGPLDHAQQMLVDLHELRALNLGDLECPDGECWIAAYGLRSGISEDDVVDEIRDWAAGHGLPFRGIADG